MTGPRASRGRRPTVREHVRARYARIASGQGCCGSAGGAAACCQGTEVARELGYSSRELRELPGGANLGLGCGNPTALASLRPGEAVLDLGSGAGIDCFLASRKVGRRGQVIGVDMTPEMVEKARTSARAGRYRNVEFRLGEVEHLPVRDRSVDVVISNCVINLAADKGAVYREAFRVLRPGGRLAVADVVATRRIRPEERADPSLWSSCSSGAIHVPTVRRLLRKAGFTEVRVDVVAPLPTSPTLEAPRSLGVVSATIRATKPEG